ncbi:MAG: hypothetical protein WAV45_01055, partial [Propionibacteriaceae bacterium]
LALRARAGGLRGDWRCGDVVEVWRPRSRWDRRVRLNRAWLLSFTGSDCRVRAALARQICGTTAPMRLPRSSQMLVAADASQEWSLG